MSTLLQNPARLKHFRPSRAEITEVLYDSDTDSGKTYCYTLRFTTAQAEVVSFRYGYTSRRYKQGEILPVLYNPARPQQAVIGTFQHLWLEPLCSVAVMLTILYFCFGVFH